MEDNVDEHALDTQEKHRPLTKSPTHSKRHYYNFPFLWSACLRGGLLPAVPRRGEAEVAKRFDVVRGAGEGAACVRLGADK